MCVFHQCLTAVRIFAPSQVGRTSPTGVRQGAPIIWRSTPAELNDIGNDELLTLVDGAVARASAADDGIRSPVARFVTYDFLRRVREAVDNRPELPPGWGHQAMLCRVVADLTGLPQLPASDAIDGDTQKAGNALQSFIGTQKSARRL